MAISDKKRRRAVAELREASTGAYRHVDALDVIAGSVGVEVDGKFGHEVENDTYAALADLIDRPTCTVVSVVFRGDRDEYEVELSCGDSIRWLGSAKDLAFCPSCGRKVV